MSCIYQCLAHGRGEVQARSGDFGITPSKKYCLFSSPEHTIGEDVKNIINSQSTVWNTHPLENQHPKTKQKNQTNQLVFTNF